MAARLVIDATGLAELLPREARFLSHGQKQALELAMVLALEPKKGVPGVGMVGTENTYVVTPQGGRSLTGGHSGPILVPG